MIKDKKKLVDGFTNLTLGTDSWRVPDLLVQNQNSMAVNCTVRGGYIGSRPGYKKRSMLFSNPEIKTWVESHAIQGDHVYDPHVGPAFIVFSCGGRIFTMEPENEYRVSEITPTILKQTSSAYTTGVVGGNDSIPVTDTDNIFPGYPIRVGSYVYMVVSAKDNIVTATNMSAPAGVNILSGTQVNVLDPNPSNLPVAWFVQAEEYMVIQNGKNKAIIYDGAMTRRATINPREIPVGKAMAYSRGRIWVAVSDTEFAACDIVGGPTGVLGFTENDFLNEGGYFSVPESSGRIRAMRVIANLDATLGQGPLQICTDNSVFSVNAPPDRDSWKSIRDPIQTVSLTGIGALGQKSTITVNGDLFFRAKDGIRSFIMARREFGQWGNKPVSVEMRRILDNDYEKLLEHSHAVLFNNRILFTAAPRSDYERKGVYHKGIVSMNLDTISGLAQDSQPVWEGLWTGMDAYTMTVGTYNGVERCFAFGRDPDDGVTEFWEITKDDPFDTNGSRIESYFESRGFTFGNPFEMKKLYQAEIWVDSVKGDVDFSLDYKPDQYPCWFDWPNDISVCAKYKETDRTNVSCNISKQFNLGYRTRLRWGQPPELYEEFDNKPKAICYQAQLRLSWTGHARIKSCLLKAVEVEEQQHAGDLT